MVEPGHHDFAKKLGLRRILLPVVIGLAIVVWLILKDINVNVLKEIVFTWKSVFWLLIAVFLVIARTLGYMVRIRILTRNSLNWRQSFRVIMLWEFTSAITPSTVGGTGFAIIF
jgi:hypothetical protein